MMHRVDKCWRAACLLPQRLLSHKCLTQLLLANHKTDGGPGRMIRKASEMRPCYALVEEKAR